MIGCPLLQPSLMLYAFFAQIYSNVTNLIPENSITNCTKV